ncbi:MAG: alanyl-tRNA synthetase [Actinomycetota bacterium]|jgi:alanyl-tRNA synthetase|nr:alanyl-tRNA synthetase [Actinomycetota bacterium]
MPALDANSLRRAYTDFFVDRGHTHVPSSPLVLTHPTAPMFVNAGMNQFVEYLNGELPPPYKRATTVQKCVRLSGKHNDIAELGKTRRHLSFFEMLGNWSFGDYYKEEAIEMAWELCTEVAGFDGDRLWVTVHETDDEAEEIWRDKIGVPAGRIQRLGKENFWEMGDTGPCGPSSEIHFDAGPEWGEPGGPAAGSGDRYVEFWNLVFMDRYRNPDGSFLPLPSKNVDTGGGLERWLMLLEGVPTVYDTDAVRPLVATAERISSKRYRAGDERVDTALRVIGDHARTMTFIVNDGIAPSNEGRGYVLRGVIRRAVRLAYQLGVERPIGSELVMATVEHMGEAYPELKTNADVIADVVDREEARFRTTLRTGSQLLEEELEKGRVSGATAFALHDTFGFPVEITEEIAEERGAPLDRAGFDKLMAEQKQRSRDAGKTVAIAASGIEGYRQLVDEFGTTEFTGYTEYESAAKVVAILPGEDEGKVEVFLDRTPFYAEGGGQVGDTGTITSSTGTLRVLDTTAAVPGLHRHLAVVEEGSVAAGQEVTASIDAHRRDAIRRNHTGTHLLHWALREVLGPHVKQQGSLVGPDYLRFDFSHHSAVTPEQLAEVERLANERILDNEPVRAYETAMAQAKEAGAIMFFGDKYGEVVRVVEAGHKSMELCGGTHVNALGMIGPIKVTQETSIGANLRRIFALTGEGTLDWIAERESLLTTTAALAKAAKPEEVPGAVERLLQRQKGLEDEVKSLRAQLASGEGKELAASAVDGVVVARRDGLAGEQLKDLAVSVRNEPGIRAVMLAGTPDGERVALAAAVAKDSGLVAGELVVEAAKITGGGGNAKAPDVAVAGGKDVSKIDDALAAVRATLGR